MSVGKVTISSISKLNGWLWDTHVTGFGARKQTNGTFYYVRYRHNGTQTVKSIGRHGPLTPDTARAKAKQLLGTSRLLHLLLQFDAEGGATPKTRLAAPPNTPPQITCEIPRPKTWLVASKIQRGWRALPGGHISVLNWS
jgi:hypothetical protein